MNKRNKSGADRYIVRTQDLDAAEAALFKHPLNPNSEILLHSLSDRVGMARMHLHLGRIPAGKESFLPHAHGSQEEFLFILEGTGTMEIDGERAAVGPGDYAGFPVDGAVHHLINTGTDDLVYLMGGERNSTEVSRFPTLGKIGIWADGVMRYVDADSGQAFSVDDFIASGKWSSD